MMSHPRPSPGLLVSVRSAEEAAAALAGGAHLIDVKEPDHGPLGRAADPVRCAVLDAVAGRRPVSAALGELSDALPPVHDPRLAFVKWGLARCGSGPAAAWQQPLDEEMRRPGTPHLVVVAYADWRCAQAPDIAQVLAYVCRQPGRVLLIDTYCKDPATLRKDRPNLLDWLAIPEIVAMCAACHAVGVRIALAGSLTFAAIDALRPAHPDWFAVRGLVCEDEDRKGRVVADRVRCLADYLL
jgi:uncharacterized protein (UPF0264 family)